jgi:hypothetical protein
VPGSRRAAFRQIHHHLHPHGPLALMMAVRQPEFLVELPPHGSHRPVAHHRQGRIDIHSGHEPGFRIARAVHALVAQPDTGHALVHRVDERRFHGHAGPDLHRSRRHQLTAHVLQKLAQRHHQAALLMQERGHIRQLHAVLAGEAEGANQPVRRAQRQRAAAGAHRVQQIDHFLARDRRGHGNLAGVEIRQGGANAARPRHYAGNTEADVVGALVAQHLERQPGIRRALHRGRAIGVHQLAREGGQKTGGRRPEAHAHHVHFHLLPVDGLAHCG